MNKQKILIPAYIILIVLITDSCINDDLNSPPGPVSLTTPLNAANDVVLSDSLTWQEAIDPDGDLVKYDVYFGTNTNPVTVVSTRQEGTSYTPELLSGTTYYWKILAQDGAEGTSESEVWAFSTTISNRPPDAFTLLSPANGTTDNLYIDFQLQWNASTDPDGDAVVYDVILSTDANPTTVISSDQTGTTYSPILTNGTTYFWKVVAKDGKGGTRESIVWSFTTINYPPGEINLTAPDDAETDVALGASLIWDAPPDQDGDALTYDVYFGTSETPATIVSSGQAETSFSPTLSENTLYYWKIIAHDGNGGMGYSPVWGFRTIDPNNPPGAVILRSPANGAGGISINPTLTWYEVTDPDGDAVTYDVYFGTSKTNMTVVSSSQTGTSYTTPTLNSNVTYYWRVVAKDGNGGTSESADWSFITVIF